MHFAEDGMHIYGACVSPHGKYWIFTRSTDDFGNMVSGARQWPSFAGPRRPTRAEAPDATVRLGPGAGLGTALDRQEIAQ